MRMKQIIEEKYGTLFEPNVIPFSKPSSNTVIKSKKSKIMIEDQS